MELRILNICTLQRVSNKEHLENLITCHFLCHPTRMYVHTAQLYSAVFPFTI